MNRNVPPHWKIMELREVAEVVTGSTPSTVRDDFFGGEIPFVTPTELIGGIPVTKTPVTLTELGAKKVRVIPENSVMVCCIGSLGKIGIAGTRLATNQQINSLVFDEKIVCPRYGFHYCQTLKPLLIHLAPSTTVPIINKGRFQELQIPLPPLPEQKRIAAILDKADSIRRKRQEAVRLTEELLRSVFLEMFGDPVGNPKGWPIKSLGQLIVPNDKINYGVVQPGSDFPDGVPIVRVGDFKNCSIDKSNLKTIDPAIESKHKKSRLIGDEVLIACVGSIGNIALADSSLAEFNIVRAVARVRPSKELLKEFLANYLLTTFPQSHFLKETRTVSQPTLNISLIEQTPVILPPIGLQNEFVTIVNNIRSLSDKLSKSFKSSDTLFNALTQRAFKGEL